MSNYVYEDSPIQLKFTWRVEDSTFGYWLRNNEEVTEVYTYAYLTDIENGISPICPENPTPKGRYQFTYYEQVFPSVGITVTPDMINTIKLTTDATFLAKFRYLSGGDGGGDVI